MSSSKSPYGIKLSVKQAPRGMSLREFAKKEMRRIQQEELPIENIKWKSRRSSADDCDDYGGRQTYREQGYYSLPKSNASNENEVKLPQIVSMPETTLPNLQ